MNNIEQNDREWQTVTRKKKGKQFNKIICTFTKSGQTSLQGAKKRKWIYLGKIQGKEIAVKDVEDYMKQTKEINGLQVKKLETKGENSAFTIGVTEEEDFRSICDEAFWPEGVVVREFSFRNFFQWKKNSLNT